MATMLERNKKVKAPQKTRAEHMEDALYREVWEDVNNEKTMQFIKKYSKHMMVAALMILMDIAIICDMIYNNSLFENKEREKICIQD